MKVALAQINTIVGDLEGNVERCLEAMQQAESGGADLVVFPEMTIPGYPPRDILFDTSFIQAVFAATRDLAQRSSMTLPAVVGSLAEADTSQPRHPGLYNAAFLVEKGKVRLAAAKRLLPAYDVFHEPRWFLPGPGLPPLEIAGKKVGVLICEDLWDAGYPVHPAADLMGAGAEMLVCLVASPYRINILEDRLRYARRAACPLIFTNLIGATDELVFDGRSFVLDSAGELIAMLKGFDEDLQVVDLETAHPESIIIPSDIENEIFPALSLGIRDFTRKNGLSHAFLGLSGGVDSAVTTCLAVDALGPERVTAIAIPSRYTDPRSTESARQLASSLGIRFEVVDLKRLHLAAEQTLPGLVDGTSSENIQARLRMLVLMSFVNQRGGFLLNTSNKTELSCGYSTLYGDMAGTLSPLGDLIKPEVYALARHINARKQVIPDFILERPPSAELKAGQVDPFDYDTVAPEMEKLVLENRSDAAMRQSEHKRWQMGIVLKVSEKSFGTGRLIPITRR